MLSVAVIEDDDKDAERLFSILEQYQRENNEKIVVKRFCDAENFLTRYKSGYDLVFMDIKLGEGGINGLAAAKKMRKLDPYVALIFTTSMARYAVNGYEVDALDFLIKPLDYYKVKMRLDRLLRSRKENNIYVVVASDGSMWRISASDIYYVEVLNHTLMFHTKGGDVSGRGVLRDVEKTLVPAGFARCSISYLVNLNYFSGIKGNTLYIGDCELRITRGKKKQFLQVLSDFMTGGRN